MSLHQLEIILGKGRVKKNFNISPYLTLKNSVLAQFYFEASSATDLIAAKKASLELQIPLFILGGGSNLAITKKKLNGLTVHNKYIKKQTIKSNSKIVTLLVSSGYPVTKLVKGTVAEGLAGIEYHLGLPGTVGGAVYMNSKWTHPVSYLGDNLVFANLIDDNGSQKKVDRDYFHFAYDYSILQKTHEIVLEAAFHFKKTDQKSLEEKSRLAMGYRRQTQPFGYYTSGCFFRNISDSDKEKNNLPTTSAGYLIDKASLKGKTVGDFYVSDIHANFIINKGNGDAKDLTKLVNIIKKTVNDKFGIILREEVILI